MFQCAITIVLCAVLTTQASELGCTSDGKTFKVGEQYDVPGHCNLHVCKGNDEWTTAACGIIGTPQGWSFVLDDPCKPYPQCCARAVPPLDIVPDVLDSLKWSDNLEITYEGGIKVNQGNEITPTQVKNQPAVNYSADDSSWYLICMTDPDAPSRQDPKNREFLHWLVGNIPGNNIPSGEVLAEYVGSGPPKGTGLHRYVFLVYKQPGKLTFDVPRIPKTSPEGRPKFSIRKFAKKYKLGDPIAINVYQAQYDDYVPLVHQQLGFKTN